MQQYALAAVDIGDLGFAGSRRHEARVVGKQALGGQAANVHDIRSYAAGIHGQFDCFVYPVNRERGFLFAHQVGSCNAVNRGLNYRVSAEIVN